MKKKKFVANVRVANIWIKLARPFFLIYIERKSLRRVKLICKQNDVIFVRIYVFLMLRTHVIILFNWLIF